MKFSLAFCRSVLIFTYLIFAFSAVSSQEKVGNETLALEYFREGNFEKALPLFAQLIRTNPDNAMYNYYYGVSLVKNNIFETAAKEALLNAVVDKTPANSNFYLANYFHALGNWQEAMDFYNRYSSSSSRQERKALNADYYINLCRKKINPFVVNPQATQNLVFNDTVKKTVVQPDIKNLPIPDELLDAYFTFQVNDVLVYHSIADFRSEAAKVLFTRAWMSTARNDSIVAATDSLRKEHEKTVRVSTRLDLVQQIVDGEQKSYQILREREKYFEQARAKEAAWWDKAGAYEMNQFKLELQEKEQARKEEIKQEKVTALAEEKKLADEAALASEYADAPQVPENADQAVEPAEPAANVVYKVQIGSFRNGVLTASFKSLYSKLSQLRKIDQYTDEKKYEIYTVGSFNSYKDVTTLKEQLILEGAKGAFVVAYNNGKKIPVTDAIKITGNK